MKKTITFPDESKYVGEVKNGKPNGKGTLIYPDKGGKYEGEWKNGKYHGNGKLTYYDGGIYIGEFKNGKCNGYGEFKVRGGQKYSGNWKEGKYHGHGTLIWRHWDENSNKISNEKYNIEGISIAELETEFKLKFDTLILDIEGAEYKLFKETDFSKLHISTIIFELHDFNGVLTPKQVIVIKNSLTRYGYMLIETIGNSQIWKRN